MTKLKLLNRYLKLCKKVIRLLFSKFGAKVPCRLNRMRKLDRRVLHRIKGSIIVTLVGRNRRVIICNLWKSIELIMSVNPLTLIRGLTRIISLEIMQKQQSKLKEQGNLRLLQIHKSCKEVLLIQHLLESFKTKGFPRIIRANKFIIVITLQFKIN